MELKKAKKKVLEGIVTSDKMDKTIVVSVTKRYFHPLYKKVILRRKKYKAHDEENKAKAGNNVQITECRPYSKEKRFRLAEILK